MSWNVRRSAEMMLQDWYNAFYALQDQEQHDQYLSTSLSKLRKQLRKNTNRNRTNEEEVPYHVPLVVVSPSLTPQHTPILPHRTPENGDHYDAETSTTDADTVQKETDVGSQIVPLT